MACEEQTPKLLSINKSFSQEQKCSLVKLLKEYQDLFVQIYEEMLGLDEISLLMKFISPLEISLLNNKQECLNMRQKL